MKDLRSAAGRAALRSLAERKTLLGFDFDGTLAPIAPHPDAVVVAPAVLERLERLQRRFPVAIVTGRARADVLRFFPFEPSYVIGNHGAEGTSDDASLAAAKDAVARWRSRCEESLGARLEDGTAWIEDKTYSLTVHSRNVSVLSVVRGLADAPLSLPPVRAVPGIRCMNLLPAGIPSKGEALLVLLERAGAERALYAGDDVTDEDVFRMEDPRVLTVRIGRSPGSKAAYYLPSQADVGFLLDELLSI